MPNTLLFADGTEAVDDFEMFQGDDAYVDIEVKDFTTKAPRDISSFPNVIWEMEGVEWTITKQLADSSLIRLSNSVIRIPLDDIDTDSLLGTYTHQLRLIDSGGNREIVLSGSGRFKSEVF